MNVDFHCHSTASDGSLSPAELVARAQKMGVDCLAITDHDTMDGYLEARQLPDLTLSLVAGVELSCTWGKFLIHVVGLNVDADCPILKGLLADQQSARLQRAVVIGERLAKLGFEGAYDYAAGLAGDSQIGRPHFAQFLLEKGYVSSIDQAFKRYLGAGKVGDVKLTWPHISEVVQWINNGGGAAVLAHPLHYKMTATKLRALLTDFAAVGGAALEVINGKQSNDKTRYLAELCEQFQLQASLGSDFHNIGPVWSELGQMGKLPPGCQPVWANWTDLERHPSSKNGDQATSTSNRVISTSISNSAVTTSKPERPEL